MQQEKLKGVVRNKNLKEWFSEQNLKGLYNIDGATKKAKSLQQPVFPSGLPSKY